MDMRGARAQGMQGVQRHKGYEGCKVCEGAMTQGV